MQSSMHALSSITYICLPSITKAWLRYSIVTKSSNRPGCLVAAIIALNNIAKCYIFYYVHEARNWRIYSCPTCMVLDSNILFLLAAFVFINDIKILNDLSFQLYRKHHCSVELLVSYRRKQLNMNSYLSYMFTCLVQ